MISALEMMQVICFPFVQDLCSVVIHIKDLITSSDSLREMESRAPATPSSVTTNQNNGPIASSAEPITGTGELTHHSHLLKSGRNNNNSSSSSPRSTLAAATVYVPPHLIDPKASQHSAKATKRRVRDSNERINTNRTPNSDMSKKQRQLADSIEESRPSAHVNGIAPLPEKAHISPIVMGNLQGTLPGSVQLSTTDCINSASTMTREFHPVSVPVSVPIPVDRENLQTPQKDAIHSIPTTAQSPSAIHSHTRARTPDQRLPPPATSTSRHHNIIDNNNVMSFIPVAQRSAPPSIQSTSIATGARTAPIVSKKFIGF